MLNISAHYEFADGHDDGGIENWGIWGITGLLFKAFLNFSLIFRSKNIFFSN